MERGAGNDVTLFLTSEGGGAVPRGEPVPVDLGDTEQSSTRCQILLRLPGRPGRQHEDHRPRRAAHLEDQQVQNRPNIN